MSSSASQKSIFIDVLESGEYVISLTKEKEHPYHTLLLSKEEFQELSKRIFDEMNQHFPIRKEKRLVLDNLFSG